MSSDVRALSDSALQAIVERLRLLDVLMDEVSDEAIDLELWAGSEAFTEFASVVAELQALRAAAREIVSDWDEGHETLGWLTVDSLRKLLPEGEA